MNIGCGWVSSRDQHPEAQHDALDATGCGQLLLDEASAKFARGPELAKAPPTANRAGYHTIYRYLDVLTPSSMAGTTA